MDEIKVPSVVPTPPFTPANPALQSFKPVPPPTPAPASSAPRVAKPVPPLAPKPALLTGWATEKGKEVFRDGGGNVRGEVLLPDTSTNFFRSNYTDGIQNEVAPTLEVAKARIERHVAGM